MPSFPSMELFEGFNLGDQNLVEIFCETSPLPSGEKSPNIELISIRSQRKGEPLDQISKKRGKVGTPWRTIGDELDSGIVEIL
ncbi:hypothetical protein CMV_009692 [Castanea mollissima]|uniref:Uncharacterized protein n=1 Tax=Castanea mollissima TaxID=60419 RepID=A0A8J4VMQ3_9ROSI|nr:hypothetical protein CMV_009692 [Castanea mollissima]